MNSNSTTNFSSFLQDAQQVLNRCLQLLASKNHDYSESQDAFANFKVAAHIAGIPTEQTLLTLLGMKFARLHQLTGKNKTPKHEAVEDTLMDIINYTLLLRGVLRERSMEYEELAEARSTPSSGSTSAVPPEAN
ncbi:DUF1599 domain-containing protein [Patescibacteria group bacterium]|nr:DUF1599 domain-containing protein [Patescibacteria group bacterium]